MTGFVPNVKKTNHNDARSPATATTIPPQDLSRNWISVTLHASRSSTPSTTSSKICRLMRTATRRTTSNSHKAFIFAEWDRSWNALTPSICSACAAMDLLLNVRLDLTRLCVWNSLVIKALRPRSVRPSNMPFPNINKPQMRIICPDPITWCVFYLHFPFIV